MDSTKTSGEDRVLTFLFTDIEGSTTLWERYPTEMRLALARHDQVLRSTIEMHRGRVFKTIGDAFCAVFESPADALACAREAQSTLATEAWPTDSPIKVRMAVHSGPADARDDDFFGQTLNRVARILSTGHGGQTLFSRTAFESVGEPNAFQDLGIHRLKDLIHPENIFQLKIPGHQDEFPPIKSLDFATLPNNLPVQLTSFVGREAELASVGNLLLQHRIVTLTGSGGCGKTRLAVHAAAEIADRFPDGVWFVDLAPVIEPNLLAEAVTSVVSVAVDPERPLTHVLSAALAHRKVLIVLDNCEHLVLACARLVDQIIRQCPNVRVLATSREHLNVSGEATFRVPSLQVPDPRLHATPQALERFDSVSLFAERAKVASPSFAIDLENAKPIAAICHRLDGIPLAIELAAARVRSLAPSQISDRLDDRFRLLTGGTRTAIPRQQTLRALVDWSYDLLDERERALLRRLSIFAGMWTLEAAEDIAASDPIESWEVLDLLSSLVDKSLVSFDSASDTQRYRLLETVRKYGRGKLEEAGDAEITIARHQEWFCSLALAAGTWRRGPNQLGWAEKLSSVQDDLWLALESSRIKNDSVKTAQLALALGQLFEYKGSHTEAVNAVETGIGALEDVASPDQTVLACLRYERAGLFLDIGDSDSASALAIQALNCFVVMSDKVGMAKAENLLGQIAMSKKDFGSAQQRFERASELFRATRDMIGVAIVLNNQGVMHRRRHLEHDGESPEHLQQAAANLENALAIRKELNDLMGQAETLNNLGAVAYELDRYDLAWKHYSDSLVIERSLGRNIGIGTTLYNLGEVASVTCRYELAFKLMIVAERAFSDVMSPLSGAVRSAAADIAQNLDEGTPQLFRAECSSVSLHEAIDNVMTSMLTAV